MMTAPLRRRMLSAAVLAVCFFGLSLSSASAAQTIQDPWATDALQYTQYIPQIQTFSTNVKPGPEVMPLAAGAGRPARRAYASDVAKAQATSLKLAKRNLNDLNTLRDRATRDSQESRDNRNAAIEVAYTAEQTALNYQHNSEAAQEAAEYQQAIIGSQQTLDGTLNAGGNSYKDGMDNLNDDYGKNVEASQDDYDKDMRVCDRIKKSKPDAVKKLEPKGKKETAKAYNARKKKHAAQVKAYNKKVKAYNASLAKFKKCNGAAVDELEEELNGSEATETDGLSGDLAEATAAAERAKAAADQAAQSEFNARNASLEAQYNQDKLDSDYAFDSKIQALNARRENAIVRSNRLQTEEGDLVIDSYRQSIRIIEDLYDVTDDDLGVDSSAS